MFVIVQTRYIKLAILAHKGFLRSQTTYLYILTTKFGLYLQGQNRLKTTFVLKKYILEHKVTAAI